MPHCRRPQGPFLDIPWQPDDASATPFRAEGDEMITPGQHEEFWSTVDAELADVPAAVDVATSVRPSVGGIEVSRLAFTSLDGTRVRAWSCTPQAPGPHPGLLILPGYKSDPMPGVFWARRGFAVLTLAHRGKLGATATFDPGYPGVLVDGIDDPATYAYRGIYADSIRALEVLESLPWVATGGSSVFGYSQGGPLAMVAAARRGRLVRKLAVGAPFLTAFPYSIAASRTYPYREIAEVLLNTPERRDAVFHTLAHYDALAFAHGITMPTLVYRGAADEVCPPLSAAMLYDRIDAPKEWREYPDAAHGGTNPRSLPDVAAFLADGLALEPPSEKASFAPWSAVDVDAKQDAGLTRVIEDRARDRARRVSRHIAAVRPESIELTDQHPARASLHWVSFATPDGAVAGGYLSIPEQHESDASGVLVQFPGYESVISLPHPEDRERITILTLAHRGQRGRGFAGPADLPGLFAQPAAGEPWMLEHIVDDCLLGLELLLGHTAARGPVIGVGPDWTLLVAASTTALTGLEVDDVWIEGFDPTVEEPGYPRRELSELLAAGTPEQRGSLSRTLAELSPVRHAQLTDLDLLLVTGDRHADAIAAAHAGDVERHRPHRDSATEAEWRDARRSALFGVAPAQRWRYARAGVLGP